MAIDSMECRRCGATITAGQSFGAQRGRASSWESCAFHCKCGVAYSNSADPTQRKMFVRTPEDAVPAEARNGLSGTLASAVNITNRGSKSGRFCSESSEDAVTWTVFRYLQSSRQLDLVAGLVGLHPVGEPNLLLWGAPTAPTQKALALAESLRDCSLSLGERVQRRTEPDVVIGWDNVVVFVEVKYRSRNEKRPAHEHFSRYLDQTAIMHLFCASPAEIRKEGAYELVRNWRIGAGVAGDREFALLNLAPESVTKRTRGFAAQLRCAPNRKFCPTPWRTFLRETCGIADAPDWFTDFVNKKELMGRYG